MNKIRLYILFFVFCSCNVNTELMDPLEGLKLGMRKEKSLSKIVFYKNKNVIDESNIVNIEGEQVKVSFLYCKDCFGFTLEGITLESSNAENLYQKLKVQLNNKDYILEKHIINSSFDMMSSVSSDTLICFYTNKMKYEKQLGSLRCNKANTDPCW